MPLIETLIPIGKKTGIVGFHKLLLWRVFYQQIHLSYTGTYNNHFSQFRTIR